MQLEDVAEMNGSIRAEFRISFDRLASMVYLYGKFGHARIQDLFIVLPSTSVSDLGFALFGYDCSPYIVD